jgi:hypothetical protein
MRKWLKYDKHTIFSDKTKGGLLVNFIKDYQAEFGEKINISCGACWSKSYNKFYLKYTEMQEKTKCDYVLLEKFNGIKCKKTGKPRRNADLTNEQAIELLKSHPHGEKLFAVLPKVKEIEVVEETIIEAEKPIKKVRKSKKK